MSKIYPDQKADTIRLDKRSTSEIYKQQYTQDRYALYLRRIIGQDSHKQQPQYNVQFYDEWIPLFGILKIKSVAIAEKGYDAYLAIGEYWLMFFLLQFFCSLLFVSGPDQDCNFTIRCSIYFSVTFIYGLILYWIYLNTRMKDTYNSKIRIMRVPFVFSIMYNAYLVFAKCNAWNSLLISYILFEIVFFLMMYSFLQQSWESTVKRRFIRAFLMSWILSDMMGSIIFGEILILFYQDQKKFRFFYHGLQHCRNSLVDFGNLIYEQVQEISDQRFDCSTFYSFDSFVRFDVLFVKY
eukprot:TRINITY_DN877_c0_g3_i2.p1 TRINITY_DN877_c0_g3~~TRINITY_DN877_c0_g3_i2.p1  ORF type:complete len:295 (+),score=8.41 TRINITY_DN877_c0_g3_i2:289-1173(+)